MVAYFNSNPGIVGTVTRAGPVKAWCAWKLQMSEADRVLIYIYIYMYTYVYVECQIEKEMDIHGISNGKGTGQ